MKHESISSLIHQWRDLRSITQAQLAKKLGYSTSQFISNVERGICSFPVKKAKKLAKILDIPYDLLKTAYIADLSEELNQEFK
jgi:transcriptional regulator with XRE-family HTH domain